MLARLDPEDAKLAAQGSAAQLASAESDFALAQVELDRNADLLDKKFISQSAFDAKQNAFNAAQARVEQMRTQAAITSNQAAYTTLVADADGVVDLRRGGARAGGHRGAAGAAPRARRREGSRDQRAREASSRASRSGQDVGISLWADPDTLFAGRVREIAGGADPVTRTYTVRVSALGAPAQAQLGMTANVVFNPARRREPRAAAARRRSRAAATTPRCGSSIRRRAR